MTLIVKTVLTVQRTAKETDERGNAMPVGCYAMPVNPLNPDIYLEYTRKDIGLLKENLQWLAEHVAKENIFVRVPSIPNHNTPANIEYSIEELKKLGLVNIERFDYITPKQLK